MKKWAIGGIIGLIVSLPWIILNFNKSLANSGEMSLVLFTLLFLVIALFKVAPIIIIAILFGVAIDRDEWIIPFGFIGLLLAWFFLTPITTLIFRTLLGVKLIESPGPAILTIFGGFGCGALVGWIIKKLRNKK